MKGEAVKFEDLPLEDRVSLRSSNIKEMVDSWNGSAQAYFDTVGPLVKDLEVPAKVVMCLEYEPLPIAMQFATDKILAIEGGEDFSDSYREQEIRFRKRLLHQLYDHLYFD